MKRTWDPLGKIKLHHGDAEKRKTKITFILASDLLIGGVSANQG